MKQVKFTAMADGDRQDYDLLCNSFEEVESSIEQETDKLIHLSGGLAIED